MDELNGSEASESGAVDEAGQYTCFFHPTEMLSPVQISDTCEECGRSFAHPLLEPPDSIRDFEIVEALGRGFYGATYVAVTGNLKRRSVLKVIPVAAYERFEKDFAAECIQHNAVAGGTEHLVNIQDYFDEPIRFADEDDDIQCHVMVLDEVDGETLHDFLGGSATVSEVAQLAADLFALLIELEAREAFHNDLHTKNLMVQRLAANQRRDTPIQGSVRLVAVDLGSISDASRSSPDRESLGDISSAVAHLRRFIDLLLTDLDNLSHHEFKLAKTIEQVARNFAGDALQQRNSLRDAKRQIEDVISSPPSAWFAPSSLQRLDDGYNAQALHPGFVPKLMVDPEGEWLRQVGVRGPQIITGMRGCGKTMLLRSLQINSRLMANGQTPSVASLNQLIESDGFIGLYVSCDRILDRLGRNESEVPRPFGRLFVAYAREALRVLSELADIGEELLWPRWWTRIGEFVSNSLGCELGDGSSHTPNSLEHRLQRLQLDLERDQSPGELAITPANAFSELARIILGSSEVFRSSSVYFLLDDVSTRHLSEQNIKTIFGSLLFNNDVCAFKMTTEAQTLELSLPSAGLIEPARAGRDYKSFDLAASVNEQLRKSQNRFLSEILRKRSEAYQPHPVETPVEILGKGPLEDLAWRAVRARTDSATRKSVYHGISALSSVCVGDIGDVLQIYDAIVHLKPLNVCPVPAQTQNSVFYRYCSQRLYHLSRRGSELKRLAMGFSEASNTLLLRSASRPTSRDRLRQYTKLHVDVSEGNTDEQLRRLRELVDAGVFVLEGGPDAPRQRNRDSDPVTQFILTFRKIFGITNLIGLASSDRFELRGERLSEWLSQPSRAKEILLESLGGDLRNEELQLAEAHATDHVDQQDQQQENLPTLNLLTVAEHMPATAADTQPPAGFFVAANEQTERRIAVAEVELSSPELGEVGVLVAGMGFEERTLESIKRILDVHTPETIRLLEYSEAGRGSEIRELASSTGATVEIADATSSGAPSGVGTDRPTLIDVTGLSKRRVFQSVRGAIRRNGTVFVAHTRSQQHFPRDEDIEAIFDENLATPFEVLERASRIWSGDLGPYNFQRLINSASDGFRSRALLAAASAKHERLLSLLDERTYDLVEILQPTGESSRAKLARLAAGVAQSNSPESFARPMDVSDLDKLVEYLEVVYSRLSDFCAVELALTGSKLHAVACAAVSVVSKFDECWCVEPQMYDHNRFTLGTGSTKLFRIDVID